MAWLSVALGGALGAMLRFSFSLLIKSAPGALPLATLSANVLGSFLMGCLFVVIVNKGVLPEGARHFLMVGMLGAFTTFSTFSLESIQMIQMGYWQNAALYMALSITLSFTAVMLGFFIVNKIL